MSVRRWSFVSVVLLSGCAARTANSAPLDMSQAAHAEAAAGHEAMADDHAAAYDPAATAPRSPCGSRLPCWTSSTNPTEAHRQAAEAHARAAADHRAASVALVEAERAACVGLTDEDRDMSPFAHVEDISSVAPLTESRTMGKTSVTETTGAVVTFRALPGLTAEWLQRVMTCHIARNQALNFLVPEMPECPLVPRGAEVTVSSTGTGFAVAVRSSDAASAVEILARAEALVAGRAKLPR